MRIMSESLAQEQLPAPTRDLLIDLIQQRANVISKRSVFFDEKRNRRRVLTRLSARRATDSLIGHLSAFYLGSLARSLHP